MNPPDATQETLAPVVYIAATTQDRYSPESSLDRELKWYGNDPSAEPYKDLADVAAAQASGRLQEVDYVSDAYMLNPACANPHELFADRLPLLNSAAHALLVDLTNEWRNECKDDTVRLAVTSLTRTVAYQDRLIRQNSLAAPPGQSTHNYGGAFDLDLTGYYKQHSGTMVPVGRSRDFAKIQSVYDMYAERGVTGLTEPLDARQFGIAYNSSPVEALLEVAQEFHADERANVVVELPGDSERSILHVAANPDYSM